jgi:hypothetical protein
MFIAPALTDPRSVRSETRCELVSQLTIALLRSAKLLGKLGTINISLLWSQKQLPILHLRSAVLLAWCEAK